MSLPKPAKQAAPRALLPNHELMALAPFRQGKSELSGVMKPIKLSANESHLGPSPAAVEAYNREPSRGAGRP